MKRITEFQQHCCQNCTKKYEREENWVMWLGGEKMNFGNDIIEIHSTVQPLPVKCSSGSARMIYQLW